MRVGVAGTGRMGTRRAELLAAHPEVDEVVIGSRDAHRGAHLADAVGGRSVALAELLEHELDACVVAVETSVHLPLLEACADRRIPVLCEKPVTLDADSSAELHERFEDAGVLLQVAFHRRHDPGYRAIRSAISEGRLGTLLTITLTAHDADPPPAHYIATSGGIFKDMALHDFDAARWLTGEEIETVFAVGAVRELEWFAEHDDVDTAAVLLQTEGGVPVLVSGTRLDPGGYDNRADVFGSKQSVSTGLDARTPLRPALGDPPPAPYEGFLDRFAEAYANETIAFVDVVQGRAPNPCSAADSAAALAVAVACEQSRRDRIPVQVSEVV